MFAGLVGIVPGIGNYMRSNVWAGIAYPFHNFQKSWSG